MSININLQDLQNLNDINLSSVTNQFQTFNIQLQRTADKKREVSKVFDGLGGAFI